MQRPICDKGVPEYLICESSHCTMCSKRERECRGYVMGMEIDPEDVCDLRMENPALDQDIRTEPDCGKDPKSRYYESIGRNIGIVVDKKQVAYGDSFGKAGQVLRVLYPNGINPEQYDDALAVTRIVDKLFRIANQKDAFGESPYRDIAGYAILGVERGE